MTVLNKTGENELIFLGDACPRNGEPPLPIPRFGKAGPSSVVSLTESFMLASSTSGRSSFLLKWTDAGLGVCAELRLEPGSNGWEIVAHVSGRPEHQGQELVLALDAATQLKFIHRTVTLMPDEHNECGGSISFGPMTDVQSKLGDRITAEGFLLEPPREANRLSSQS